MGVAVREHVLGCFSFPLLEVVSLFCHYVAPDLVSPRAPGNSPIPASYLTVGTPCYMRVCRHIQLFMWVPDLHDKHPPSQRPGRLTTLFIL